MVNLFVQRIGIWIPDEKYRYFIMNNVLKYVDEKAIKMKTRNIIRLRDGSSIEVVLCKKSGKKRHLTTSYLYKPEEIDSKFVDEIIYKYTNIGIGEVFVVQGNPNWYKTIRQPIRYSRWIKIYASYRRESCI